MAAGASPRTRALAAALRRMKADSGLTYADLAKRTKELGVPHGAATLSRAAAGAHLPRLDTVRAFARAAADRDSWHAQFQAADRAEVLWAAVGAEQAAVLAAEPVRPRRSTAGLARGLAGLRARAGQPSLTRLQKLTTMAGHRVPRSTLHLLLGGRALPTGDQLAAVLAAFDAAAGPGRVVVGDHRKWLEARNAIERRLRPGPPEPVISYGCIDGQLDELLERRGREEEILRKVGRWNDEEGDSEEDEYSLGILRDPYAPWEALDEDELAAWEAAALAAGAKKGNEEDLAEAIRRSLARS
ncbi:hypothetical protein HUT16_27490 [Kitasatospora sp. NA04385]|uniref:helix-turn-helix domain-containing protein n=1 Tax=Kitasatospora sp. NA04385 TaxID=2742135 RepID=UPI001591544C|nr:helix-turn-helix domain-containing protein [Kitasatospora sp. NA04385]QKW22324.1 hypothetical protein HUT16_27490 [Kitasatospora sp. NA04385]